MVVVIGLEPIDATELQSRPNLVVRRGVEPLFPYPCGLSVLPIKRPDRWWERKDLNLQPLALLHCCSSQLSYTPIVCYATTSSPLAARY